jgi:gliding motility-associated-like protein
MLQGCAPFELEIINLYRNSTDDAIFTVDWGDGTIETFMGIQDPVDGGAMDPIYTPDFSHTYLANNTECGYDIVIWAENPCTMEEDARIELSISVWDTDQLGLAINPGVVRVCQGFAANVTFEDVSDWNCFPRTRYENRPPRWIQWEYNGGTLISTNKPAGSTGPVVEVYNTGERSDAIQIPAQDPSNMPHPFNVGDAYLVTLHNWNRCNPLGEDPVNTDARIVIVGTPDPDFSTHKDAGTNPVQTDFCVDDVVYFKNATTAPGDAVLGYTWQFFDGPDDSHPLLDTRNQRHTTMTYPTGGTKLVRLIAGDDNVVGDCRVVAEKVVHVYPTSIAQIDASQTKFCKDPGSNETFTVVFEDISIGETSNTQVLWEFYDEFNVLQRTEGWSKGRIGPFTETYSNPGTYRVKLYTKDSLTDCYTSDEVIVVIYNNPSPDFASLDVCYGEQTALIDHSTLQSVHSSKITTWEWDLYYDGATVAPDTVFNGTMPDTLWTSLPAGTYQVALRVTNDQYACSATTVKQVDVFPLPSSAMHRVVPEGCSPFTAEFINEVVSIQPVPISEYIWCVNYGGGFIDTIRTDASTPGITATFVNDSTAAKNFCVKLKAVSDQGCIAESAPDTVRVLPTFRPGFSALNYDPFDDNCAPVDVLFQVDAATIARNPSAYTWRVFKSGEVVHSVTRPADQVQFNYEFTAEGVGINAYEVSLTADIAESCVGDSVAPIRINPVPESGFTIDTLEFECEYMRFAVEADQGGMLEYQWVIQEGMGINMSDSLEEAFIYTVTRPSSSGADLPVSIELRSFNYAFCASEPSILEITVPRQPLLEADISAYPEFQVYPNTTVECTNTSLMEKPSAYWDFGDGTTVSTLHPPAHTYVDAGEYTIALTLEEDHCYSSDTVRVVIEPTPPVADFTAAPTRGCAPLTVSFTNLSRNVNFDNCRFDWSFGEDQLRSNAANPTHTYYKPGTYSVRLEVTNSSGQSDAAIKMQLIEVYPAPVAAFDIRPTVVAVPDDPVYITNFSKGAVEYYWEFGDGGYSNEASPVHVYTDTGTYNITLVAVSDKGCKDTTTLDNVVQVINGNNIRIPNAFTPSLEGPSSGSIYDDGRNDIFYPVTEGVVEYKMQIYNRWGELIFETVDRSRGWNGYYKGKICPQDVYIYKIDFRFWDGTETSKFGDVTLIR